MKEISEILKQHRINANLSLEDMSEKTKIQMPYLIAIEDGDIDKFKNDISYLKYYIRFYCRVIDYDFELIREKLDLSIDEFSQTMIIKKIDDDKQRQNAINRQLNYSKEKNKVTKKVAKKGKDYSFISLFVMVIIVVICIMFFVFNVFFKSDNEIKPPVIVPTPTTTPVVEVEDLPISIVENDATTYIVNDYNVKENISIKVNFNNDTWIRVYYDDVVTNNPVSKVYNSGEVMEILITPVNDMKITIHFGIVKGNEIYINEELVVLNEQIKDLASGQKIDFVLKGE